MKSLAYINGSGSGSLFFIKMCKHKTFIADNASLHMFPTYSTLKYYKYIFDIYIQKKKLYVHLKSLKNKAIMKLSRCAIYLFRM